MKTIYHVHLIACGEYDFFFDENGQLLDYWDCSDFSWESGMASLLEALGFEVKKGKRDDARWSKFFAERRCEECLETPCIRDFPSV